MTGKHTHSFSLLYCPRSQKTSNTFRLLSVYRVGRHLLVDTKLCSPALQLPLLTKTFVGPMSDIIRTTNTPNQQQQNTLAYISIHFSICANCFDFSACNICFPSCLQQQKMMFSVNSRCTNSATSR